MSRREEDVNRKLSLLGEACHVGRITRDEYRLRRRRLLERFHEADSTTTPNSLITQAGSAESTEPGVRRSADTHGTGLPTRYPMRWRESALWGVILVLIGVLVYAFLSAR